MANILSVTFVAMAMMECHAGVAPGSTDAGSIESHPFGALADGRTVELFDLRNARGMVVHIITYGGIVTSLTAPDRTGHYADVVLGYDSLAPYLKDSPYFGAIVGRYANRIAKGRFVLDGETYTLAVNNGPNALHGGLRGFDKVLWLVASGRVTQEGPQLVLTYRSVDSEEGYPGTLEVTATYTLLADNALRLAFTASTDRDTVVNLTNHSYFNLRGYGDILGHVVQINADRFTPVDTTLIPTGELRSIKGTPFDFRDPKAIGARISQDDEQLRNARGYDHNWVINQTRRGELTLQATIREPETGRVLEVLSTEPGLQFYTGNFLDGSNIGKGGRVYTLRSAFTVEPQAFPDSPNHPNFPSTVLEAGSTYHHTLVYRFRTE